VSTWSVRRPRSTWVRVPDAVNGKPSPGKQGQRQGQFSDDERAAKLVAAAAGVAAAAIFEALAGIDAGGVPGRSAAEEQAERVVAASATSRT
jgi:hypothetical protein